MSKKFLIPSLLAAGLIPHEPVGAASAVYKNADDAGPSIFDVFRQAHKYTLAGHSSHASHGSHSSHRSSSGGGYTAPRAPTPQTNRNITSTPPSSVLPSPQAVAPRVLPGNSAAFQRVARLVQTALQVYGYYNGAIDGVIGDGSRSALSRFQSDYGLRVTGTITPEVLDAFGISAN